MKLKYVVLIASTLAFVSPSLKAAVGVGYVANVSVGSFISAAGSNLTAGGVSVGYFGTNPDSSFWSNLSSATPSSGWSSILTAGFTDVRSVPGVSQSGGFDWSFPENLGGTVSNIPIATLAAGTRLYVIGFNAGSFSSITPSSSWTGATEWGVVSAMSGLTTGSRFESPADLGTKALNFGSTYNLQSSDVLIGSLASNYSTSRDVLMVPEPSTYALLALGGLALFFIARRRKAQQA